MFLSMDILHLKFFFFKKDIMNSEKSYDSLPNFTAADCKYLIMLKCNV